MERDAKKGGTLDRRRLLKAGLLGGGSAVAAAALAGCGETQVVEVVKEVPVEKVVTQIVEKAVVEERVVTQIVEKEVVVEKVVTEAPAMRRSGTVTYWSWWAPTLRLAFGAWDEFLRTDFEKNNPGIKAEVQFLPFGDLVTKTIASLAGGEAPDALHASVAFARDLYDKNALISMNDYIKVQPEYAMDNYFEGSTFFNQYKGQVFGIPGEGPEFTARAYNTEHFDAAGLASDPQELQQWTSEMWVEAALKLTQRDGDKVARSGWVAINQSEESWAANS
ncbi:MAG: extracellular solute-binding protein, partial [Chloroflexi bacterium]|nr:extracellular solute-binding protein [Chloroflexota bacterium]